MKNPSFLILILKFQIFIAACIPFIGPLALMRFTKISDGTDPDGDGQVIQNLVISVNGTAAVANNLTQL